MSTMENKKVEQISVQHLTALYELTKEKGNKVLTDIWTWRHSLASLSASERPRHLLISRPGTLNEIKAEHLHGLVISWDRNVPDEDIIQILSEYNRLPEFSSIQPSQPKRRWWRRKQ